MRNILIIGLIIGTAASAWASVGIPSSITNPIAKLVLPQGELAMNLPVLRLSFQPCAVEDCSDTPQNF